MVRERVILTNHAIERAEQINLPKEKIKDLLMSAKRQQSNPVRLFYKVAKYGINKQCDVGYYYRKSTTRFPALLFTVKETTDKEGVTEWVVLTVTKK